MSNNFNVGENINLLFERLENFFKTKTVVGEPIEVGDATLIPFITTSFGLGSGSGTRGDDEGNDGTSGGSGISAKITPTAILVIKKDDIQVIPIKKSASMEELVEMVPDILSKFNLNLGDKKEKKKGE
ncbi:spore germination protein GerW family protein [Herbivorax sp. ANBcel31]|uniref:GerW family sporulation protein n=1 Tax=Herbivorax sp. ANBcel31 TaxID=3069754 RepID=UPI0027B0FA5D|nr:spore germination protein GerW family protein [Herbivorax sp. ANBcel31]MDQ2087398.1 spore germination protein GerW family protein [Herbivorax sp. ANBcel31]